MGVQCRTMLSQRPCGSSQCTREECSRARVSTQVFMVATNDATKMWCPDNHGAQGTREWCEYCGLDTVPGTNPDTENDVTGSESAPQTTGEGEPLYALTGLTRDDVDLIQGALWSIVHGDSGWETSEDQLMAERLIDRLDAL